MTKKHFKELAKMVSDFEVPELNKEALEIVRRRLAVDLAHVCYKFNSRFNFARFYEACRVKKH